MRLLAAFLLLALPAPALAQVEFDAFPRDGQLYPRDARDQASVLAAGRVTDAGWDEIELRLYRNGVFVTATQQSLSYAATGAPFSLAVTIDAGKFDYAVELEVRGGGAAQLLGQADYLCSGDVYLVTGQSNAAAPDYWSEKITNGLHRSKWVRSFGTADTTARRVERNLSWYVANGETSLAWGSVGSWPLRIGWLIQDRADVPVALLNGAVGGRPIAYFARDDANPANTNNAYGRLLFRAQQAGLAEHVRGIFWYQGESDGPAPAGYAALFADMLSDWQEDYPALQRAYVVQVRRGCAVKPHSNIMEIQRQLPLTHPEVELMSANALPGHDGCHYVAVGYFQLADHLARLVGRDFYGLSFPDEDVLPPNPTGAFFSTTAQDEILVEFGPLGVQLQADATARLDFFFDDPNLDVVDLQVVNGNQLVLTLNGPAPAGTTVRYSGHHGTGHGGWITNHLGLGALSFALPVQ